MTQFVTKLETYIGDLIDQLSIRYIEIDSGNQRHYFRDVNIDKINSCNDLIQYMMSNNFTVFKIKDVGFFFQEEDKSIVLMHTNDQFNFSINEEDTIDISNTLLDTDVFDFIFFS